jgi:hypothetical protein
MAELMHLASKGIQVKIRMTSSGGDQILTVYPKETIQQVKGKIIDVYNLPPGSKLRLISSGKLLTPDHAQISTFSLADNSFIHCVVSQAPQATQLPSYISSLEHKDRDVEEGIEGEYRPDPASLRGFDRLLRREGISIDQVAAIRATFRPYVDEMMGEVEREEGESDMLHRLRVEEEWMAVQPPNSEFAMNIDPEGAMQAIRAQSLARASEEDGGQTSLLIEGSEVGSYSDFVWGFVMGSILGFIMLFWLWDRSVSYRQKMGIMAGVSTRMAFSIIYNNTHESKASDGVHV